MRRHGRWAGMLLDSRDSLDVPSSWIIFAGGLEAEVIVNGGRLWARYPTTVGPAHVLAYRPSDFFFGDGGSSFGR